jgi:hypothetical protein
VKGSIYYLVGRANDEAQTTKSPRYFDGIELKSDIRAHLKFAERFLKRYFKQFPGDYVYTDMLTITDGIYAIGKGRVFHKTLTNTHFARVYDSVYPEFKDQLDAAARSQRLVYLSSKEDNRFSSYDYVKFKDMKGLFIYLPRERAEQFSMP